MPGTKSRLEKSSAILLLLGFYHCSEDNVSSDVASESGRYRSQPVGLFLPAFLLSVAILKAENR